MVYSHYIGKWLPVTEVTDLRNVISRLDEQEESSAAAAEASANVSQAQMVFIADEEDHLTARREFEAYCERVADEVKENEGCKFYAV